MDILAFIFSAVVVNRVKWAYMLRKYFDSYVLNIKLDQFSETDLREIQERIENIYLKNPSEAAIQIANTGKDFPPGVRNWYEFSEFYDEINAQFECQRQNTWWDSKMVRLRIIVTIILLVLIGIGFIFLLFQNNNSIWNILLCSVGILIKICERIIANWRYFRISRLIDGSQQTVEVHPTIEGIEKLQSLIDKRRSINVLGIELLHKKLANKLTNLYQNISSRHH